MKIKKKWKLVLPHPDSHGGGHFQPLEKNGIKIRVRFLFLFSYFQILRFYIGFARKIQMKHFRIFKSIMGCATTCLAFAATYLVCAATYL